MSQVNAIAANLQDIIARDVSIEKIREKLGGAPVGGGSSGGSSGGGGANTAAIDDLLDDV